MGHRAAKAVACPLLQGEEWGCQVLVGGTDAGGAKPSGHRVAPSGISGAHVGPVTDACGRLSGISASAPCCDMHAETRRELLISETGFCDVNTAELRGDIKRVLRREHGHG